MNRLKIISANLLAEKPYSKFVLKNDSGNKIYLFPAERKKAFVKAMEVYEADIYFFQEVDQFWKEALNEVLVPKGFTLLTAACWSSAMAIAIRTDYLKDSVIEIVDQNAGIQALSILQGSSRLRLVNIHARWGYAAEFIKQYYSAFRADGPLIIAGDFNLDKPQHKPEDNMNQEFFNDIMELCELKELTSELNYTARYVKDASRYEKLDLILGKYASKIRVEFVPSKRTNLLPHTEDPDFKTNDPANHFSDHGMVLCEVSI